VADNKSKYGGIAMQSYTSFDAMAAGTGALNGGGAMSVFNVAAVHYQQMSKTVREALSAIIDIEDELYDAADEDPEMKMLADHPDFHTGRESLDRWQKAIAKAAQQKAQQEQGNQLEQGVRAGYTPR
jgi:hypothetical protein